jgi:hypothetical protein
MPARFYWNKKPFMDAVRVTTQDALNDLREPAHAHWLQIAPVGVSRPAPKERPEDPSHKAGTLRDSWYAWLRVAQRSSYLCFGAFTRYAYFVEVGTSRMTARSPVRKTSEAIAPMMLPSLFRAAARHGLKVR